MKKMLFLTGVVLTASPAFAGWRLADCKIIEKVGGGFAIIGTSEATKNVQLEPFGPYQTLVAAEKTLELYKQLTNCVNSVEAP